MDVRQFVSDLLVPYDFCFELGQLGEAVKGIEWLELKFILESYPSHLSFADLATKIARFFAPDRFVLVLDADAP